VEKRKSRFTTLGGPGHEDGLGRETAAGARAERRLDPGVAAVEPMEGTQRVLRKRSTRA
jgi:hypothetical protein